MVGAFIASLLRFRLGIFVLVVEMFVGMTGGDFFSQTGLKWVGLLAAIGTAILAFFAGAKLDPRAIVKRLKENLSPVGSYVLGLFLGSAAFAFWVGLNFIRK